MEGFAQFQDDLRIIYRAVYTGQVSAAKLEAQAALMRVRRFAQVLENLDLGATPECTCDANLLHASDCPARPEPHIARSSPEYR